LEYAPNEELRRLGLTVHGGRQEMGPGAAGITEVLPEMGMRPLTERIAALRKKA